MTEAVRRDLVVLPPVADDPIFSEELADARPRLGSDPHEFAALYMRHRWSFALHARRFLNDQRDIDEVVQEGFLKLFLALPELENELQALAYARRTITNLCIDRYRADQRRPRLVDLETAPLETLLDEEEIDPVIAAEDAAIVREALAQLSPLHREALLKREVEEKPLPQIAAELDIPVEQVKHVLYRARQALRRLLVGTHVEPGVDLDLALVMAANRERARNAAKPTGAAVIALLLVLAGVLGLRGSGSKPSEQIAGDFPSSPSGLLDGGAQHGLAPAAPAAAPTSVPTHVAAPTSAPTTARPTPVTPPAAPVVAPTSGGTPSVPPPVTTPPTKAPTPGVPTAPASSRLALTGLLQAKTSPTIAAAETFTHSSGTEAAFSKFVADTTQGPLELNQTLSSGPDGSLTYEADTALPVGGAAVPAELAPADETVQRNADGTVSVVLDTTFVLPQQVGGILPTTDRFVVQALYAGDLTTLLAERVSVGGPTDPLAPLAPVSVTEGNDQGGTSSPDGATVRQAPPSTSVASGRENPLARDQDPLPAS